MHNALEGIEHNEAIETFTWRMSTANVINYSKRSCPLFVKLKTIPLSSHIVVCSMTMHGRDRYHCGIPRAFIDSFH